MWLLTGGGFVSKAPLAASGGAAARETLCEGEELWGLVFAQEAVHPALLDVNSPRLLARISPDFAFLGITSSSRLSG